MAVFNKPVITNSGLNLLSRAFAGDINIEFVQIAFGSGIYTENEKAPEILQDAVTLKEIKQVCYFSSKSIVNNNRVLLKTLLSNEALNAGYYINEVGIFAKEKGKDDASAVLYSIAVAKVADYMPEYNGSSPVQIIQEYYTVVNDTADITITQNNSALALAEDLNTHIDDNDCHITSEEREMWNETFNEVLHLLDTDVIESAFYEIFTMIKSPDPTAMTTGDIENALETEWNGEESPDPTAMTTGDIENALETEWNGEESTDPTAMTSGDILEAIE